MRGAVRQTFYLLGLLVLIFALWPTQILTPLKILVVFFHEASHALTAVATGGSVREMVINPSQGGHVISTGDIRFLTLSAGYLGSLLWGVIIFLITVHTNKDRVTSAVLGVAVLIIAAVFVRNLYGLLFSIGTGAALLALARWGTHGINDFVLRVIGLTSMAYAPLDIWSDTISRSHLRSDARMLAEEFGGFTMMWGGIWMAISAVVILWALRRSRDLPPGSSP